ncbi:13590_t:CDS:2, partial [Cetraspora pellucida]
KIQENHSEIISPVVLTILRSRGFFTDLQYLSDVLFPIKEAILAVEANRSTFADCYINLVKIAVTIQNLPIDEYKGFRNKCVKKFNKRFEEFNDPIYQLIYFLHLAYKGLGLKFGTFPFIANYAEKLWQQIEQKENINENLNSYTAPYTIKQLCHTQTAEIISEIITNIAKTVFKEFEEEILIEEDDIKMLNPAENLYPNEQDLDLSISTSIDFKSSVFTFSNSYKSENFNEIEFDNNIQESEYNVDEIVAAELNYSLH